MMAMMMTVPTMVVMMPVMVVVTMSRERCGLRPGRRRSLCSHCGKRKGQSENQ